MSDSTADKLPSDVKKRETKALPTIEKAENVLSTLLAEDIYATNISDMLQNIGMLKQSVEGIQKAASKHPQRQGFKNRIQRLQYVICILTGTEGVDILSDLQHPRRKELREMLDKETPVLAGSLSARSLHEWTAFITGQTKSNISH